MLVNLLLGFSSGLPLALSFGTLQAWMHDVGVDLGVIGLFVLVGLPYSLKFVWAPLMDRYTLSRALGRRRGWLIATQIAVAGVLLLMSRTDPSASTGLMAFLTVCLTFCAASQDIVADAYRRESLADEEIGFGTSLFITSYRVAMMVSGAVALGIADKLTWPLVYMLMACCMGVGVIGTFIAEEPQVAERPPRTLVEAVIEPFREFFLRNGVKSALMVLGFIVLYKIGDNMASAMTIPFYLEMGYDKAEIALIGKAWGIGATIAGGLVGGLVILRIGINRSLWVFGVLQALMILGFVAVAQSPKSVVLLACVIAFENFSIGMASAAFSGFMATLTNKSFTATQYALLTSFMSLPTRFASAPTGYMVKAMGWTPFFVFCTLMAIPGLLLLSRFAPWREKPAKAGKAAQTAPATT